MRKLTISVRKLRSGDSITLITPYTNPPFTGTVDIVTGTPDLLQSQDTSAILPASNEWIAAVENLASAFGDMSLVTNVEYDVKALTGKTLIILTVSDPILTTGFQKNTANGSEFEFFSYVHASGAKQDNSTDPGVFGLYLVPNITVSTPDHELVDFSTIPSTNYIRGNPKNLIQSTINFDTRDSITGKQIEFSFGLVPNTTNPYGQSVDPNEPFAIDPDLFQNRTTNTIQTYRGALGAALNPLTPISFNTGTVTLVDNGGNNYDLVHTHRLLDLGVNDASDDAAALNTPDNLDGTKSLKYIFEVNVLPDATSPLYDETTKKDDISLHFPNGAIGWFDTVYKTGTKQYTVDSFTWSTPSGELNPAFNSIGSAVLAVDSGTWNVADELTIGIQKIIDDYDDNLSFTDNISYDSVNLVANGTPVSGTNIISVSASIDGGDPTKLNISLEVVSPTYDEKYIITAEVLNNALTSTVNLKSGTAISRADEDVIDFGTYPGAEIVEYNFSPHWNIAIDDAFNEVIGFTEDNWCARWRVVNTDLVNTTLNEFRIKIIDRTSRAELEKLVIRPADLPSFTQERDFRLDTSVIPEYKTIIITDDLGGNYDFQYPFQTWKNWFQENNLVLRIDCVFEQVLVTNETVTFTQTFDSPDFQLGNYDETLNTALEPQALRTPLSIQFEDEATGDPLTVIKNSGVTRVIATFEDNNLNDLEVSPPAGPFPYVYDTPIADGLTGYLGINIGTSSQPTWLRFHNFQTNPTTIKGLDNPWGKIPAHPTYNCTITRTDIKTATIEGLIDADDFKALYGTDFNCIDVTARLDAYRIPLFCFIWETSFTSPTDGTFNPNMDVAADWYLVDTTVYLATMNPNQTDRFTPMALTAVELNGPPAQTVRVCNFDPTTVTDLEFIDEHIRNAFDLSDFTGLTDINIGFNTTEFQLTLPNHSIPTNNILLAQNTQLTYLDLSNLDALAGSIDASFCGMMTTLVTGASSELITKFAFNNCSSLLSADISNYTKLSGTVTFENCTSLVTLATGSSSDVISNFSCRAALITTLDVSGYSKLSGIFNAAVCPNLTTITTATVDNTETFTSWKVNTCDLTGTHDLTHYLGLGGSIEFNNNSNLTSILFPTHSVSVTTINGKLTGITALDLSPMDNVSSSVDCELCPALASVTLPTNTNVFTILKFNHCVLTAFDITTLTGANDNISISLNNNSMGTAALDTLLSDLVATTWIDGTLTINNNSGSPSAAGIVDIGTLTTAGWSVTY